MDIVEFIPKEVDLKPIEEEPTVPHKSGTRRVAEKGSSRHSLILTSQVKDGGCPSICTTQTRRKCLGVSYPQLR